MATSLETEIVNDPLARGYSGMTDQQLLDSLNALDRTLNITDLDKTTVYNGIDQTEWVALIAADRTRISQLLQALDTIDLFGNALEDFKTVFGTGSTTASSLSALRVKNISRSEEIGWKSIVLMKDFRMHTLIRATPS